MQSYPIPMVPGPVRVPGEVLKAMNRQFGSGDLEDDFISLYQETCGLIQTIIATKSRVVLMSGEGMMALWGAMKSTLNRGDRVLAISTGVFGSGIGDMASSIGAEVETLSYPFDSTLSGWEEIEAKIKTFRPKMITAVHCETPSGTLNPLEELGRLKEAYDIPLFYLDSVASAGGTPVLTDDWKIDLNLGASQKCFSAPPSMAYVSVSEKAWDIIEKRGYTGYDALLPFRDAVELRWFPYTPNWQGVAGLKAGAEFILNNGLEHSFRRHDDTAKFCRDSLINLGVKLFPLNSAVPSPTVTAARVPEKFTWAEFNGKLREKGLAVGGSYGPMAEKVFRIGHMGSQADMELLEEAMMVIRSVL